MSQPPPKLNDAVQAQVERLTAEAKKQSSAGKESQALETYRKASELMPGAPWLQHRTAELARKLNQPAVAALHYRRAAAAFIRAGFPKRALSPLRAAWAIHASTLPTSASAFVSVTLDLAELQRDLGFSADGALTITTANQALSERACSERVPAFTELVPRTDQTPLRASEPALAPESGITTTNQPETPGFFSRVRSAIKS